jgi:hypothetical protein
MEPVMFDWFKKRDYSNVIKFPEVNTPYIEPPTPEKDPVVYYTIGHTDNNRVSLRMGYTSLNMTRKGVQDLIDQLTVFQSQLHEEDHGNTD